MGKATVIRLQCMVCGMERTLVDEMWCTLSLGMYGCVVQNISKRA